MSLRNISQNIPAKPGDMPLRYMTLNISTGTRVETVAGFISRAHFYELLDKWNGQQPGVWQYWSVC